jgi:hypothetical protein
MEVLAAFIDEECIAAGHANATAKTPNGSYKAWGEDTGDCTQCTIRVKRIL